MKEVRVPYLDLWAQHEGLREALRAALDRTLEHGGFVLGPELRTFEERFAAWCATSHCVGVGSGTDALILVLRALELRPGDEVITAPNSFVATAAAIVQAGGRPVFADVGGDLLLDPERVEDACTPRTRVILPVHLAGRPADMPALAEIARRRGLRPQDVVEPEGALSLPGGRSLDHSKTVR